MSKANREKRTSVRANTAKYTPEKPLFGKYVGSVYRPEHERGLPESTTVQLEDTKETPMRQKRIYLAGKIHHGDWRHSIVKGLSNVYSGDCSGAIIKPYYMELPHAWPILPNAVFGLDYAGPYFVGDDHGCCHGADSHGAAANNEGLYDAPHGTYLRRDNVISWCLGAIDRSDIFFAWLEDTTCYGTLAEIGFARALHKTIWIAGTKTYWEHTDLWFACNLADELMLEEWLNPSLALQILIAKDSYKRAISEALNSTRETHVYLPTAR